MSRLEIFTLLHSEIIRILESMNERNLALEVEKRGINHEIYD